MAVPTRDLKSQIPDFHFDINKMETLYDHSYGKTSNPHRHNYYTVVLVLEAKGKHIIDFNSYALSSNQIFFVAPGQVHQLDLNERPEGWVITFNKEFLTLAGINYQFLLNVNLFRAYSESPPIDLKAKPSTLISIVDLLQLYFKSNNESKTESLGSALKLFLIECVNLCDQDISESLENQSCILIDFKQTIEENYKKLHKVSEYAELLHITPNYLNEVIKSTTGITAKEYIIDRLITEAKRLLIHTTDTVKEIALSLGFKEPLHFNTFFKNKINQTPLEFRKTHQ